jgi:dihydrolipoamide dehydrogenase
LEDFFMSDVHHTQLLVIGGGPGGYAAAFLAADLNLSVTLVDMEKHPGGVCLFRGCIPSKALLHAAKILSESREAHEIGLEFAAPKIHLNKLQEWKNSVVTRLTGGLGQLCQQRKINFVQGRATLLNSHTVKVTKTDKTEHMITYDHCILATGSAPIKLPFAPESARVMDSTTALDLKDIPPRLLVVGGGYIGLELGTVYHELGSKVTVVEMLPHILMGADRDLAVILEKRINGLFKGIMTNTKVTKIEELKDAMKVTFEDKDGKSFSEEFDKILVSIGRRPNTKDIGLENTQVQLTQRGFIQVNDQRQTTDPKIYAIGDIAGDPMLAHKASHEGRVAVEAIAGHKVAFEPAAIPAVVFTDPEIAWCGLTETEAKAQNREVKVVKFPWAASGRAITLNRIDGLTKLIIDPQTERVLGVAIAGVGAGEMIAEGVLAVEMGSVASDIKLSIHPHPTLSETIMESAESFFGQSTHIYRPKK